MPRRRRRDLPDDDSAPPRPANPPWADPLRHWVLRMTVQRVSDTAVPEQERRLLAWIAYHLMMSDHLDVAVVTRRFLASGVQMTAEDAEATLDRLVDRGFVRIEYAISDERQIALRLVVQGLNDTQRGPWEH